MKEQEKQIEEMKDIVHNLWDKLNQDAITTNDIIDALYNAGYRKLPEDSVVLSKEELEEKYEPSEKFMSVARELEDLKQNLEDKVVLSREEWKRIKNSLYYSKNTLEKRLDQASKETAEKLLSELYYIARFYYGDSANVLAWAKEKAEKLGIEIKE